MTETRVTLENPPTIHAPAGYSHLARVRGGPLLFIAGQVALDVEGNLVGPDDYTAQAEQVFTNLRAALTAAGASFRDVAKITYFVRDLAHLPEIRAVRDRFLEPGLRPASTAVGVCALARPDLLIEIEAVAAPP